MIEPRPRVDQVRGGLISFDQASHIVAAQALPLGTETIALEQAEGRILAADAVARHNAPASLTSAMDGYAVRDCDLVALAVSLPVAGSSFAGKGFGAALPPGACVRIFTGAPAPAGTDRVIVQEEVTQEGAFARFNHPPSNRRHLRPAGCDSKAGEIIVPAGSILTPQRLMGVAASDQAEVSVFRRPRVSLICCGDELAEPGDTARAADSIPESISWGVAAMARRWGGTIALRRRIGDDLSRLQAAAAQAAAASDVVVVIGGASAGAKDLAKQAFADQGLEMLFGKVAVKPGKPVWFGRAGPVLVLGLPGNPTAALVTARLFLAPLLAGLSGGEVRSALDWQMMRSDTPVESCSDRDLFLRATIKGRSVVTLADQDSASQKALAGATHLVRRRMGEPGSGAHALVETLFL